MAVTNPIHGKNGLIYVSATELANANSWSIQISSDSAEGNVFGDTWKSRTPGLKDFSGNITEHMDEDSDVIVTAAMAATSTAFLIYPVRTDLTKYYSGSAIFGASASGDMSNLVGRAGDFVGDGVLASTGFTA